MGIIHKYDESNVADAPWGELDTNMGMAIRLFQKAARVELDVGRLGMSG